jgi:hydroxymethylpyrimidine/phosphomethylpyrimidine kinase
LRQRRLLLLGGLEPAGRAGLLADVETARSLGAAPLGVATALTAQGGSAFSSHATPAKVVGYQLRALLEHGAIDAAKIGMVPNGAVLRVISRELGRVELPRVFDPVVRTSRGERLSSLTARDYLRLAQAQVVLTPNLEEAQWLLGLAAPIVSADQAAEAGLRLVKCGFEAVVVKGGHAGGCPVDVVVTCEGATLLAGRRLVGRAWHRGTGCRFATALAAGLASGMKPVDAAKAAKAVVYRFLAQRPGAP